MQISLKTKLGNTKLAIACVLRKLDDAAMIKLVTKALQFIIWHDVPAKAFAKDEPFKRDSEYSPALEAHLIKHATALMTPYFDAIGFETALVVKADPKAKLIKEYMSLGFTEADATSMAETVIAKSEALKAAKTPATTPVVETAVAA